MPADQPITFDCRVTDNHFFTALVRISLFTSLHRREAPIGGCLNQKLLDLFFLL
jgi:hypothetical protein